jgi:predicted RNase H-like nuclease (RuvC/YqgF family)
MAIRTKLIISAVLGGAALSIALPAQAQNYPQSRDRSDSSRGYDGYQHSGDRYDDRDGSRYHDRGQATAIRQQIEQLERRIRQTDGRDRISEREAATLRRAVSNLRQQYRDYSRNGLTQREAQVLQSRIQQLRQRLSFERRDNDGRRW